MTEATHAQGQKIKVIFENCYLNDEQKIKLCQICGDIQVDWVKTSTGYGTGGATDEDLILMRKHSPDDVQVKAAGGVRDLDRLLHVRALGAYLAEIANGLEGGLARLNRSLTVEVPSEDRVVVFSTIVTNRG